MIFHRHLRSLAICALAPTLSSSVLLSQDKKPHFSNQVAASSSTTAPDKIHDAYWNSEFERVNKAVAETNGSQLVFFGDSITLAWSVGKAAGKPVWEKHFAKYNPINMGNSGDITPVMLYRVNNGNLDFAKGQSPRVAVLLCGTNNYGVTQSDGGKVKWDLGMNTPPKQVADGIRAVAQTFRRKLPETRIILLGILPVKNEKKWAKCRETNKVLADVIYPKDEVTFLDLQDLFLNDDGLIKAELFTDGTHLTTEGYQIMANALSPHIERLIKMQPLKQAE
ncbi:MAG: GDSL-type esterase/lipase family protein [Akkermansiaceae bacterium]